MENASKALNIAAGVLIGVLILSLLVFSYNQLRALRQAEENSTSKEQEVDKFNKQFDGYIKDVYGSDMLSVANKAQDYNNTQYEYKGYSRVEVIVTFTSNIGEKINGTYYGFKAKKYTTDDIISNMVSLQSKTKEYGNKIYANYEVSELAYMTTAEKNQIFEKAKLSKDKIESANEDIKWYSILKSDETKIKSKVFKYITSSYDNTTGRIKLLEYKEQ